MGRVVKTMDNGRNRPFPSCFEPHCSKAKCKVFIMKISFNSYANKTNYFHLKNFALSLAFIVRFTATRKWPHSNSFLLLMRYRGGEGEQEKSE